MSVHLSVTDVMFGFYNGREKQKKLINRLLIVGKSRISKFKYVKHPHLLYLFRSELNITNWSSIIESVIYCIFGYEMA